MSDTDRTSPTDTDQTTSASDQSRLDSVRAKASDAYQAARDRTSAAYGTVKDKTSSAYSSARDKTSSGIDTNPVAALVGGLAIGGLVAALLPRTEKEKALFGTYGSKINDRARSALSSAKEAGIAKLDELGYNKDAAQSKISSLKSDVAEIASAAAQRARNGA
jgi:ElaB/YqjD/DUF883 family membrane-anchored ribosome-binding protein